EHAATQANIELLRTRGAHIVEPEVGRLASLGEQGVGRLAEPRRLLDVCEELLKGGAPRARAGHAVLSDTDPSASDPADRSRWSGLRVLVTAGGTREPIDSVRFVGNSSSGRMGFALAATARERGAEVTLVAANVGVEAPAGVTVHRVHSAAELEQACEREFPACDVLLMAAAVADFRPVSPEDGKIKKGGRSRLTIELEPTADVLCGLSGQRRPGQTLVGFAAEHGAEGLEHARAKLATKGLDAVVFNDISRADIGFESTANEVTILTADEDEPIPRAAKEIVAERILDTVERLRKGA
ncbi:MAG TPA: phosphopantothenoylcysteine decarboxylase, partial [Solirubrobacteraceae bacterium]